MAEMTADVLAKAADIVKRASNEGGDPLAPSDVAALVTDVAQEILDASEPDEQRLARVESQTHALAQAVIAIGESAKSVAPAVEAVKAGMQPAENTSDALPTGSEPRWNECPLCHSLLTDPLHQSPDGHGYRYFKCSGCGHLWERDLNTDRFGHQPKSN